MMLPMVILLAADQSALRPAGPQSAHIHWLWNVMLWVSVAVYAIVMVILLAGVWHRRKATRSDTADGFEVGAVHCCGCRRFYSDSFRTFGCECGCR